MRNHRRGGTSLTCLARGQYPFFLHPRKGRQSFKMRLISLLTRVCLPLALLAALVPPAAAETREIALPTAFRPDTLNSVTTSPSAPVAFTASRETDSVFAFDPRNGALLGKVEVGDGPLFIRMRESGGRRTLAVSCDGQLANPQNLVAIVDATDPANMRVTARALVPEGHVFLLGYSAILFSPDGSLLIAAVTELANNTTRGTLVSYDATTGQLLASASIGFAPSSADLAARDGRVVVAVSHATHPHGTVTLAEIATGGAISVSGRVTLPQGSGMFNVNTVALSADGRTGYVCSAITQFLFTFDTATGEILSRSYSGAFPTYVHPYMQNGAQRLLVVAETSAAVFLWDMSDPRRPVEIGNFYSGVAFIDSPAAITPDAKMAFATSSDGDLVIAIDLTTGQATYNEVIGDYPVNTAVYQDGSGTFVTVLGAFSDDVHCLEATSRGFRRRGSFAGEPNAVQFGIFQNVALSADGRYAFVASLATDELLAIDIEDGRVAGRIQVGDAPAQVAVGEDGLGRRRVAVLGSGDSKLVLVDASLPGAMAVLGSVDLESPSPFYLQLANIAFSPDAGTIYVADGWQFVTAIDAGTLETLGVIGTGFAPVRIALREAGGKRLLAALNASPESTGIALVDVTDPRSMRRLATYTAPHGTVVALNNVPVFSVDGKVVVFGASITDEMFVVNAETGALVANVKDVSPLRPEVYFNGGIQRLAALGAADSPARVFRFLRSGGLRLAGEAPTPAGSFRVASNLPFVSPDGAVGVVPDYGRGGLLLFNPANGAFTGEIELGGGPSEIAVDWVRGRAVVINANGTSGSLYVARLADAGPLAAAKGGRAGRSAALADRGLATTKSVLRDSARVQYYSTDSRKVVRWRTR